MSDMEKPAVSQTDEPADAAPPRPVRRRLMVKSRKAFFGILFLVLVLFWVLGLLNGSDLGSLLSLTVWGIMLGGIIALGAIGLTLVYGVLKFPNFAHGALITIGAYTAFAIMRALPEGPALRPC